MFYQPSSSGASSSRSLPYSRPSTQSWEDFKKISLAKARSLGQSQTAGVQDVLTQMENQLTDQERWKLAREQGFPESCRDVRAMLIHWKTGIQNSRKRGGSTAGNSEQPAPQRRFVSSFGSNTSFKDWIDHHDNVFLWGRVGEVVVASSSTGSGGASSFTLGGASSSTGSGGGQLRSIDRAGVRNNSSSESGASGGKTVLPRPATAEQNHILKLLHEGRHVAVEAKPGAGKTSTALFIAEYLKRRWLEDIAAKKEAGSIPPSGGWGEPPRVLLLVFNKFLARDTRERAARSGLMNLDCRTFHAWFVYHLDRSAHDDRQLRKLIRDPPNKLLQPVPAYSVLIFDEAQDINPLLFKALYEQIIPRADKASGRVRDGPPRLLLMGQREQKIYHFNLSDHRFLTQAGAAFGKSFAQAQLSETFRIPQPIAKFINIALLRVPEPGPVENEDEIERVWIVSKKPGEADAKPRYWIGDVFDGTHTARELEYYVDTLGVSPDQIFVLAPSVGPNSPAMRMANNIDRAARQAADKVAINFYKASREEGIEESGHNIRGKVVISSYHQAKGLERDVVLVFGFDESYFLRYKYACDLSKNKIPNPLYVAVTRAKKYLTVFHDKNYGPLPFLNPTVVQNGGSMLHHLCALPSEKKLPYPRADVLHGGVPCCDHRQFAAHLPEVLLSSCLARLRVTKHDAAHLPADLLDVPARAQQQDRLENVSQVNEVALLLSVVEGGGAGAASSSSQYLENPAVALKQGLEVVMERENTGFLRNQITTFDWIHRKVWEKLGERMSELLKKLQLRPTRIGLYDKGFWGYGTGPGLGGKPSNLDIRLAKTFCASTQKTGTAGGGSRGYNSVEKNNAVLFVSVSEEPSSEEKLRAAVVLALQRKVSAQPTPGGAVILCPISGRAYVVDEKSKGKLDVIIKDLVQLKLSGIEAMGADFPQYVSDILAEDVVV